MNYFILLCALTIHAASAELPASSALHAKPKQDLKTAESSRLFSWNGGNRYPTHTPNFPNYWWYNGNGYHYPNYSHLNPGYGNGYQYPNYSHLNPGYGNGYPSMNYPNYGFGNNGLGGYPGGYPGGYGYSSGFGNGYNGFNTYSGRYKDRDTAQQVTARGAYIYKR